MSTDNHCMVDLETLDTVQTGTIVSIGAVAFDPYSTEIKDTFYTVINIADSVSHGLTISEDTVKWWSEQEKASQQALKDAKETTITLRDALTEFSRFFKDNKLKYLWGNGVGFDNVILNNAYDKTGMIPPWKFWDDLCYRTVKTLNPNITEIIREGTYHNALDDALHQTKNLQKIFRQDKA